MTVVGDECSLFLFPLSSRHRLGGGFNRSFLRELCLVIFGADGGFDIVDFFLGDFLGDFPDGSRRLLCGRSDVSVLSPASCSSCFRNSVVFRSASFLLKVRVLKYERLIWY